MLDEPTYAQFLADPVSIFSFLSVYDTGGSIRVATFPKLSELQTTWTRYRRHLEEYFQFRIDKGNHVLDIGAHHGIVALNTARLGATVIALEPNPINFAILGLNVALNPTCEIIIEMKAAARFDGVSTFNFGKTSTTGALVASERDWKRTDVDCEIESTTLQSVLTRHNLHSLRLLKIDCEGGEYDFLLSTSDPEVLRKAEYIYIEAHPTRRYAPSDIDRVLKDAGFSVTSIPAEHGCVEYVCKRQD